MSTRLPKLLLYRSWIMTQQLGGGGVQIEEGDGGLAGHQELGGYGWVTTDGREKFTCFHWNRRYRTF